MTGCLVRKLRFLFECSSDHTQVKREEIMLTTCVSGMAQAVLRRAPAVLSP